MTALLMRVAPLAAAALVAFAAAAMHRVVHPRVASRMLATAVAAAAVAAVPTLLAMSLAFLAHLSVFGASLTWCAMALGIHEPIPAVIGVPVIALTIAGAARARRVLRAFREMRCVSGDGVEVCERDEAFAFTLPGPAGQIVVSRGLLTLLDDRETDAVIAHEQAHARHRHDRYLLIARLAAAAVPPLRPLTHRLEFSLERWADEEAARAVGDRAFVARTLGKVALAPQPRAVGVLAATGLGVPGRVATLLGPIPATAPRPVVAGMWTLILGTALLAVTQLHHIGTLIAALCRG